MDDETTWGPFDRQVPVAAPAPREPRRVPKSALAVVAVVAVSVGLLGLVVLTRGGEGNSEEVTSETTRSGPAPAAVLAAAPAASRGAGTARIRSSMRSFEGGQAAKQVVEGTIAFDTQAYDLTFGLDGGGWPFRSWSGAELQERIFSDGTTIWTEIPAFAQMVPPVSGRRTSNPFKGKKYISEKVSQTATAGDDEFDVFGAQALGFSIGRAPADVLTYLNGVGTAVREGDEQLDGEEVTRFGVDLDLDALQRALPSEDRDFDAYDFKPDVPHSFPAKVWLDRQGRLRKLTYRLDLAMLLTEVALKADYVVEECDDPDPALLKKVEAGDRKAMATLFNTEPDCTERPPRPEELVVEGSVEMSAYGTPLSVTAPPAAEVLTSDRFEDLMETEASSALDDPPAPPKRP